ncbi:MAG TPA: VOC family protein [Thermoanaerobaculia bacterium]|nr:VOC family protein [Thermoanaerobaculia bacterium]
MPTKKKPTKVTAKPTAKVSPRVKARVKAKPKAKKLAGKDVPQFFRLSVEVGNLDAAIAFYTKLLDVQGRRQPGSRCYFECGPVTLSALDISSVSQPHPAAKALYFTVKNLDAAFERAKALGCLSRESVHDAPGGGIVVRPWGERSFYAEDPWGNPLCFVEEGTVYTG